MTIKSDRWIKSKSMPPLVTVSFLVPLPGLSPTDKFFLSVDQNNSYRVNEAVYGDPFTNVEEEVKKILKKRNAIDGSAVVTLTSDDVVENFKPMIEPFLPMQVRTAGHSRHMDMLAMPTSSPAEILARAAADYDGDDKHEDRKIISKGLTSYGYDVSLSEEFAIFTNVNSAIIDPLQFTEETLHHVVSKNFVIIPPNSYLLGRTKEYFRIPRDVLVLCVGKSTYARCGAIVNVTPIEPGFEGNVVIEISNSTNLPLKIYTNQGIAQFLFFQSDEACETSYADRNDGKGGKYQGQTGITVAKG